MQFRHGNILIIQLMYIKSNENKKIHVFKEMKILAIL
jgi:SepF-like predicted cell division protein (DUF552 family)